MILQILFTEIAKTPAKAVATLDRSTTSSSDLRQLAKLYVFIPKTVDFDGHSIL